MKPKSRLNEANPRSPAEILAEQGHGRSHAAEKKAGAVAPAQTTLPVVVEHKAALLATPDTRTPVQAYLDEVAPASIVGRMIKFDGKEGKYFTADDEEILDDQTDYAALCDQTLVGWLKFNGQGQPPDRHMGLLYDGFVMPPRETLGDLDETQWEAGLSGEPQDPWQHHVYLVLQNGATGELFTFCTSSKTGRRAVGNLLRHYNRVRKTDASFYPMVRLKIGGFNHSDQRIGWVSTPVLAVTGRMPRIDAAKPEAGNSQTVFNDTIPF